MGTGIQQRADRTSQAGLEKTQPVSETGVCGSGRVSVFETLCHGYATDFPRLGFLCFWRGLSSRAH